MDPAAPEDPSALAEAVRRLARTSVLVVGDVMLDRYVYGRVERVSPEAPIAVLGVERELAMPGGAGNVVRTLTALGAAVAFVAVVGDDQAGSDLTGLIGGQPGVEPWLLVQGGRATTHKTRYVADGQHLLRADREDTGPIHPKLADRLLRLTRDALAATSVCVLSDYGKGLLAGDVPTRLIADAKVAGRRVIVAAKGADLARFAGADVVLVSWKGLVRPGEAVDSAEKVVAVAQGMRQAHGFGAVLVTRGEDGMSLVTEGAVRHYPAEAAEVFDPAGAGDTVAATLAAGLAAKLELEVAVRLANVAAGIVVGKAGTAVVREADLLAALSPEVSTLRKVAGRDAAVEQAERWRRRGWRVGLTTGTFDALHPGHVHLLEQARGACDRLIVGLRSDAAARRAGGGRAVQPEAARAAILAGVPAVDLVCTFDEDTPEPLMDALRPEILVVGADRADSSPGADSLRAWNGTLFVAELLPGYGALANVQRLARATG